MNTCENCGERIYGGICTNCHEELYIEVNQGEFFNGPRSGEWNRKVEEQHREVLARPHRQVLRRRNEL